MADDGGVNVTIGAAIDGLLSGIAQARDAILSIADPVNEIKAVVGDVSEAFAAAFAVEKIEEFVNGMTELGKETEKAATLLGIATNEVAALSIAGQVSGTSLGGITGSLEKLGRNLALAESGTEKAAAGLRALNITVAEFRALSPEQQLETLADRFSKIKDGIDKDAIAMSILGRSGAALIPLFNGGADALKEFQEITERAGSALSQEMTEGLKQTEIKTTELSQAFIGVRISLWEAFKPAVDGVVTVMIDLVEGFNNSIRQGGLFGQILRGVADAARGLATAFALAITGAEALYTAVVTPVTVMAELFRDLGTLIYNAFTGNLSGIKDAYSRLKNDLVENVSSGARDMVGIYRNLSKELTTIWGEEAAEHVKINQDKNAKLALVNKDALNARLKLIDSEVEAEQEKLKRITLVLNGEAAQNQITQDAKFAALESYTNKAYQAEVDLLNKKLAIIPSTELKMRAEVNAQLEKLSQQHSTEMVKLDEQALASMQKNWETGFNTLTGAFNSQLKGLLTGTTTFGQAAKNILLDLAVKGIEYIDQWVVKWAAGQLANLTATTTGAAAQAAAQTAGITAGSTEAYAATVAQIGRSAVQTFAGVFANLSPFLGPAAAAPAAAAQATVTASIAEVPPPLDVGTPYVQRGGLAQLHEGEAVLTAAQVANPGQVNGLGGVSLGGITLQAWDAASVSSWLKRGGAETLAKHISSALNSNPSLRPSYN